MGANKPARRPDSTNGSVSELASRNDFSDNGVVESVAGGRPQLDNFWSEEKQRMHRSFHSSLTGFEIDCYYFKSRQQAVNVHHPRSSPTLKLDGMRQQGTK